jgi:hypothetical protein
MEALEHWTWGPEVLVEQRRKINGEFSIHFDPDLLQAIFLHFIGVKWYVRSLVSILTKLILLDRSVFLKSVFMNLYKHEAWKTPFTEVPKVDRLRRAYFLDKKSTKVSTGLEQKRRGTHENRYFAHQLLNFETQQVEVEEGEEEAEYGNYVTNGTSQLQNVAMVSQEPRLSRAKKSAVKSSNNRAFLSAEVENFGIENFDFDSFLNAGDEDSSEKSYHDEDERYRHENKKPMESKQSLLHLVATETILNTRLHGEFTCLRTTFDSWYPLLPHQTISAVLEFLGVSEKWRSFFERYLQAPLKFADDPSSEPRLRRRGMPGSHALSDTLGEAVLLCLDFAVNQATGGRDLYRIGDDVWFWSKDYETCVSAWASIQKFTEIMGVKVSSWSWNILSYCLIKERVERK